MELTLGWHWTIVSDYARGVYIRYPLSVDTRYQHAGSYMARWLLFFLDLKHETNPMT